MHDISELVNKTISCTCGRKHEIPIKYISVAAGTISSMPQICRSLNLAGKVLLVADDNTYLAAGAKVLDMLQKSEFSVKVCLLKPSVQSREMPHKFDVAEPWEPLDAISTDERSIVRIMVALESDIAFMLAVGSGTINDLVRFVSSRTGIPYISVPTAPSVDGFASTVVPLLMDGFKRTVPGTYPQAIIADTDILCQAPVSMIAAGFGDMVGKLTALLDWKLGYVLDGEYYCHTAAEMMKDAVEQCLSDPSGIRERKPKAIENLMKGLILSGVAMMLVGNSRPASGCEHHVAHYWEMMLAQAHRRQPYHGVKVGVAAPIIALFYQKMFEKSSDAVEALADEYNPISPQQRKRHITEVFGQLADEAMDETASLWLLEDEQKCRARYIAQRWDDVVAALKPLIPSADDIRWRLEQAGAVNSVKQLNIDGSFLYQTLLNAMYVRTRYTVLRLADELGCLADISRTVAQEASCWQQ